MCKHILVVDDDILIRELICAILKSKAYEVDEAADGQSALDLIQHTEYDLIISDLHMPRMNGHQFLSLAIAKKPDTKIMIISGNCSEEMLIELLEKGAFDFIVKPFSICEFETKVETLLAKQYQILQNI